MPIPTYDQFIEPLLRFLVLRPGGVPAREAQQAVAASMGLSAADCQELLPSGSQPVYKNRIGWAHDRLKRAGLSGSPKRGWWQVTSQGATLLEQCPQGLSAAQIEQLAMVKPGGSNGSSADPQTPAHSVPGAGASPEERLGAALAELRSAVAAELLEALAVVPPVFFETIVLDLLHRMGYGTSRADLQRVGGSGDGGIDGVISLDKLGLEKVYVQAKRWQGVVGRPEVQGFYGALAGQRAHKGVFITTSSYTAQAIQFARSVERIALVDGRRLAELMIEHEVGVSVRMVRLPKFDSDYFDE